jgi:hypothetical protein
MFEQGFYDRLGFGSGPYESELSFDPALLKPGRPDRHPKRLGFDDFEAIHASRLSRKRTHGGCNLHPAEMTRAEMEWVKNGMGLGFYDGEILTHHIWLSREEPEFGPFRISWMAYRNSKELVELLGVIGTLGEQVRLIQIQEPPGIQLQDLINKPLKHVQTSEKSRFQAGIRSLAFWQARICDLEGSLSKTSLPIQPLSLNLLLTDPVEDYLLDSDAEWKGVGGSYVVRLGPESSASQGTNENLPILEASVGAWTRMWLGVRPATGLAVTDDLSGPETLLEQLDEVFRLPSPRINWEF